MKYLTLSVFILSSQAWASPACVDYTPGRARATTVTFTILEGEQFAHLSETVCDMTATFGDCEITTDAVYEMAFRPTRLQIWDLKKVSGTGPESLVWETKSFYGNPNANCQDAACTRYKKFSILTDGSTQLCSTKSFL